MTETVAGEMAKEAILLNGPLTIDEIIESWSMVELDSETLEKYIEKDYRLYRDDTGRWHMGK